MQKKTRFHAIHEFLILFLFFVVYIWPNVSPTFEFFTVLLAYIAYIRVYTQTRTSYDPLLPSQQSRKLVQKNRTRNTHQRCSEFHFRYNLFCTDRFQMVSIQHQGDIPSNHLCKELFRCNPNRCPGNLENKW